VNQTLGSAPAGRPFLTGALGDIDVIEGKFDEVSGGARQCQIGIDLNVKGIEPAVWKSAVYCGVDRPPASRG